MSLVSIPRVKLDADRLLVDRCAAGDRAAQIELYRGEVQRVHAILYRVLGAQSGAIEDLIQETFIRVFRSLSQFRGQSQLSTWIGRIALNTAYDHLRARRPPAARLEAVPELESDDPSAEQRMVAREGLRRLYQMLDRLDARQRIAFSLHAIDGRPLADVAELMDATLVATKTRVWRARREIERRAAKDPILASYVDALGSES